MKITRPVILPLIVAWLSLASATAQTSTSDTQPPGTLLKTETHAVVVDVVVTRGQDEPVLGLHKTDFQLTEDGKSQSIDFFEEHSAPVSRPDALVPLPAMPPNVYTNVPAAPLSDSVNVLLLDTLNTPRQDQSYVHRQIVEFLHGMKPDTRIAIFLLGSKLSLIQGFTDDPALLRAAIDDPRYGFRPNSTTVSRNRDDDQADKDEIQVRQQNLGKAGRTTEGLAALARSQAEYADFQMDQRVALTLEALQGIARYLAGVPGRKNLIWFASQFPINLFRLEGDKDLTNTRREYVTEIKQTSDLLTLSKVAVYPINAEGLMNDHAMDAEHTQEQAGTGGGLLANITEAAGQRSATMSAMEQIATDTGGQAVFNTNDLNSTLNRVIHNGAHYYTIVYTPTNKELNGQFRNIKVSLAGAKAHLSYRRGYYADDPNGAHQRQASISASKAPGAKSTVSSSPDQDRLHSLLVRGLPSATQILYAVRLLPASTQPAAGARIAGLNQRLPQPTIRYTADFFIDRKQVNLQQNAEGKHVGAVRVELLAYDRSGEAVNWTGYTQQMNLDATTWEAIQRSGIPAHLEIDLPANTGISLATCVYDLSTHKAGSLEIGLDTTQPGNSAQNK